MSHDSYTCRKFPDTTAFPTKREPGVGNYVGSVVRKQALQKLTLQCNDRIDFKPPLGTTTACPVCKVVHCYPSLGAELDMSEESGGGAVCPIKCRPREHKDWKFC